MYCTCRKSKMIFTKIVLRPGVKGVPFHTKCSFKVSEGDLARQKTHDVTSLENKTTNKVHVVL